MLKGSLIEKHPPRLLLDVHGVGYEVEAPMTTFCELPATGAEVTLFMHHLVREDAQQLFGFLSRRDRDVFRMLLKVNGVGAKVALAILSGMSVSDFEREAHELEIGYVLFEDGSDWQKSAIRGTEVFRNDQAILVKLSEAM